MKVLLTTCLLFALLPAVASLKCYQCGKDRIFSSCLYPKAVDCAKHEDSCIDEFAYVYIKGVRHLSAQTKRCVDSKTSHTGSYILRTVSGINVIGYEKICMTDLCNKENTPLPSRRDFEENGLECPACIALGSDHCEAQNTISCRGGETKCLYTSAMAEGSEGVDYSLALEGCTTPNLCNMQKGESEMFGGMIRNIRRLKCTNAQMSPSALE